MSTPQPQLSALQEPRIRLLGKHEREFPCQITGAIFQISTPELLIPGSTVRLSFGQKQMIATVRDCERLENDRYAISLQSVDDLNVTALAAPKPSRDREGASIDDLNITALAAPKQSRDREGANAQIRISWPIALIVAVGIVALGTFLMTRSPSTSVVTVAEPVAAAPAPPPAIPEPVVSKATLRATGLSWVAACADGKKAFERLFRAGDRVDLTFSETAIVRSGNAGGLDLTIGDKPLGVMGQPGEVRMLRATAKGVEYLPPTQAQPCLTSN